METDSRGRERVSANWDKSSSQVSRQIGPLKPLNAGGGRNTAARGVCLCVVCVRVCVRESLPVERSTLDTVAKG